MNKELIKWLDNPENDLMYSEAQDFNVFVVFYKGDFNIPFNRWNEKNGIQYTLIKLTDSRWVIYL